MNLSKEIDFNLKHFFLWWRRGLSYWVPEKIREALSDKSGYVFLSASDENLQFIQYVDEKKQIVADVSLDESGSEYYQQLLASNETLEKSNYILRLNSSQAISKILYLPLAAKENLQQVVAFEINKYTPFEANQVYFAVKQLGKEENEQLKVLLVVTPKETLDSIYLKLNNAQIYPKVVDYEQAANNFTDDLEVYNLLPEWEQQTKNKTSQFLFWLLGGAVLILIIAALVFPVLQEERKVEFLQKQLKLIGKDARLVQAQQIEVDNLIEETERLIGVKQSEPQLTELINTISRIIPDNTWLTHFKFNRGKLQIQGQSPAASILIGTLEATSLLSNAQFVSPLTQDKRTGMERFQISAEVNIKELSKNE